MDDLSPVIRQGRIALTPRTPGTPVPLTAFQRLTWDYLSKNDRLSVRMCAAAIRLVGTLDAGALETSLSLLIRRHESMRTRIVTEEGVPRQCIDTVERYHLETIDLARLPTHAAETDAARLAQAFLEEKADVSVGPLFEARLLHLSHSDNVLILGFDHIVSDAVSYEVLTRELWALYNNAVSGSNAALPIPALQFPDYAVWQEHVRQSDSGAHRAYWQTYLSDIWPVHLPEEPQATVVGESRVGLFHYPFGSVNTNKLRALAENLATPLPFLVLTIFILTMVHWCGQRRLGLMFVSHGRHGHPELKDMIGFLATQAYLRIELTPTDRFVDVLTRARGELTAALSHLDGDILIDHLGKLGTELGFNWQPARWTRRAPNQQPADGRLRVRPFRVKWAFEPKLGIFFADTPAGVGATVYYRRDLFSVTSINRLGNGFQTFAQRLGETPEAMVGALP